MTKKIEMVGKKFGRLTVVADSGKGPRGYLYDCMCECGKAVEKVVGHDLRTGHKTSCGCRLGDRRRTHDMCGTRPYHIWGNMKKRCDNPNCPCYPRYGGRGICYQESWANFENFWNDMNDSYRDGLTLDRIDNDGNYPVPL